ncbi:STM3941 family protein [Paraurantiacibacter namhicola]|uniref:STM3941 family protein n=1 Tax=Paraurantiacibacter namhicola TaxID=645517 RepID=UPI0008365E07|nr:STM3941 family protein [Paraurantiacibacter namhicola]
MQDFVAYNSRWRLALLTCLSAAFVALGLYLAGAFGEISTSRYSPALLFAVGWAAILFFTLTACDAIMRIFSLKPRLVIGAEGIIWSALSDEPLPWPEIRGVTTSKSGGQKYIILYLHNPGSFSGVGIAGLLDRANRLLTGGDVLISTAGTNRSFDEAMSAIERYRP